MAIQQKLHTKLVQKLILTPSLQQAIKLLPMSTLELADLLNQEVVENPMLEEVSSDDTQSSDNASAEKTEGDAEAATPKVDNWDDSDYAYFFGDYLDDGYRPRTQQEVKELPPIENTLSTSTSLSDHLQWQLSLQETDETMRAIGDAIIGNLDDDGYLVASVDEISTMGGWSIEEVEKALRIVQRFDPVGVAARDLQECLGLQLQHIGHGTVVAEKIVTEYLRQLQNHQVPEIAKKLGLTIDEVKVHVELIRHLDPKPGSRFNRPDSHYVIPDVYVVKVEDQYVAVLNEEGLPQLRISPVYRRLLDKSAENTDETRAYVKDKFRSALWLIKSVEQRQKTIHKVATSIITFQRDFLDQGIEFLRPLVLRDVANDIGMHESTVSRVVTNKYMHTPQGVFEMKYFFHSGISSSYGESVSSVTIKQRIRKIIEAEDLRKPLSDSKIVSILQKEGLVLARRTIAKYREELKIPTSNQRKMLY
ncbi:MAG: RNA polymerase factor sigma-54 [Acidobacteria bacterium]|nr:RNA polymerase factor sigma-54 [Acidobacteriota bacterium]